MELRVHADAGADELLAVFFTLTGDGLTGRRARRHAAAERALRACLEERVDRVLSADELLILTMEREFDPLGAAARICAPSVLLEVLPYYLEEPRWHGDDLQDRRVRLVLAERLLPFVLGLPPLSELDTRRVAIEVRIALMRASAALADERRRIRRRREADAA
jgi:hypothetical protein